MRNGAVVGGLLDRYSDLPGALGNAPDDHERGGTPTYKHFAAVQTASHASNVFRSAVPPLMAGMNLGMSERNDTMEAHRSVVAVRNSNWAENKINRGRHAYMRRETN